MKVSIHGHSVVRLETEAGKKLIIDPFIQGNDLCDLEVDQVEVDYILVTHAHADHLGDTVEIAKRTGAKIISTVELAEYLASLGLETHGMQPGGACEFDFGTVKMTPAIHGSSLTIDGLPTTLGLASGLIIKADGKTLYHLGDTALFSDMKLIGELENIDLALIPIGDNFTMGPEDALLAAKWLKAKQVIPIHYDTFPLIEQDPKKFIDQLETSEGILPEVGEVFSI